MPLLLNIPVGAQEKKQAPAIVCVHPGSSCKDQTAGLYAEKLAEQGYVKLAFDAFHLADILLTQRCKLSSAVSKEHSVLIKMVMSFMRKQLQRKKIYLLWKMRVTTIYTTDQNQ